MKPLVFNRRQSREVDERAIRDFGMSGVVLMENAGRGLADKLCEFGIHGPVVICCGKGNNGGDGFVLARHLDLRGIKVKVLLWADEKELVGDAATNFQILRKCDVPLEIFGQQHDAARLANLLQGAAWIVDALLGTGSRGEPRSPLDAVIELLNASGIPIVAVDLPSGLDCDTGQAALHTIRALHTCTFVATKTGFNVAGAEHYTGDVHVLDIGAPRKLLEEMT
jgi:NAD(P)H-hydrate epimerase